MNDKPLGEGIFGPHDDPAKCPTYYDGCHCTVETLEHNIKRADEAEAERDSLKIQIEEMKAALKPLADLAPFYCDTPGSGPCFVSLNNKTIKLTGADVHRAAKILMDVAEKRKNLWTAEELCALHEDAKKLASNLGLPPDPFAGLPEKDQPKGGSLES